MACQLVSRDACIYVNVCICYINHTILWKRWLEHCEKWANQVLWNHHHQRIWGSLQVLHLILFTFVVCSMRCVQRGVNSAKPMGFESVSTRTWAIQVMLRCWYACMHLAPILCGQCNQQNVEKATTRYLMAIKNGLCTLFSRSTNKCTRKQQRHFFGIAAAISWKYAKCF